MCGLFDAGFCVDVTCSCCTNCVPCVLPQGMKSCHAATKWCCSIAQVHSSLVWPQGGFFYCTAIDL